MGQALNAFSNDVGPNCWKLRLSGTARFIYHWHPTFFVTTNRRRSDPKVTSMKTTFRNLALAAALLGGFLILTPFGAARAEDRNAKNKGGEIAEISLLDAARAGDVSIDAEGIGDGRMIVAVTNHSPRKLNVVLPPGLVASGTTGQYGGIGGMGGMGNGMGGTGGTSGTAGDVGGMSGGTMPASMGVMMLGRLIMNLVGDKDSWNLAPLVSGDTGVTSGVMGGTMGGTGGGFRSVPPTGNPYATLNPGQTRSLPTRLVSLNGPTLDARPALPGKGEKLQIGDFSQWNGDDRAQAAMKRLAEDKAPTSLAQLVLWKVSAGLDWPAIARLSRGWANPYEIALARQFVSNLDRLAKGDSGRIYLEVKGNDSLSDELGKLFTDSSLLGLKVEPGVPVRPQGPSMACSIQVYGDDGQNAVVQIRTTNDQGLTWVSGGKFDLPLVKTQGKLDVPAFVDAVASGMLVRLVRADLVKGKKVKGKDTFTVRIDNYSPLILNGLALAGSADRTSETPKLLSGMSISPRKSLTVPANTEVVEQLGLKQGIRIIAADLSGL